MKPKRGSSFNRLSLIIRLQPTLGCHSQAELGDPDGISDGIYNGRGGGDHALLLFGIHWRKQQNKQSSSFSNSDHTQELR
jgi:hypothetical protein